MTSFASTLMIMFWTGGSADIAVQKYFRCQRFVKDRCKLMVKIFRDKVCAYNPKWDTDTCQGDSGSGLVVGASSGQSPVLVCRWDFLLLWQELFTSFPTFFTVGNLIVTAVTYGLMVTKSRMHNITARQNVLYPPLHLRTPLLNDLAESI